jgi:hypothetical protein
VARVAAGLRGELSQVEPLPPALREVWQRAAEQAAVPAPSLPHSSRWTIPLLAAAALLLVAIGLVIWNSSRSGRIAHRRLAGGIEGANAGGTTDLPAIQPVDAAAQFSELLARIETLQHEIDSTVKQAELLDARTQADRMIATYSRW